MNSDYKVNANSLEVARRNEEIIEMAYNLSMEEQQQALMAFARAKWHRLNNENPYFSAKSGSLQGE